MAVGQLRIIAGNWRSRHLKVPPGIRPSQDAHRETLFNVLGDLVEDATCIDLYAGTGSLGLEALSRGARHVTFVERSKKVAKTLRANIDSLDAGARAQVRAVDVAALLRKKPGERHSLAFVDPPFAICADAGWWQETLDLLSPHLAKGALACCESPKPVSGFAGWRELRSGRIGAAHWMVLERQ